MAQTTPEAGDRQELVQRLNEARQQLHISVRAAARIAGVPTATAQGWLNGRHLPTPALRANFLELLDHLGLAETMDANWWIDSRYSRVAPQLRVGHSPYLGLRAYTADDRALFFGRTQAVADLASAVRRAASLPDSRIVVLVGASGSGKSSMLAAGLSLATQPGQPLAGLRLHPVGADTLLPKEASGFTSGDVVVVDQFEDVLHRPEAERAQILDAIRSVSATATVVIGLRADAFAQASLEPVLAGALSRPVLLAPLTTAELRLAVTEPASSRHVVVEDELVTVLLKDLGAAPSSRIAPGVLPLVSTALLFTWAAGSGDRMTLTDYLAVGGVGSAVEQLADGVHDSLGAAQQQLAENLFLRLLNVDTDSISCSSLPLASLEPATREVVDAFADARILTLTGTDVRISHEALLRHWPRLTQWIENSREKLFVLQQLKRAALLWTDDDRAPESLIPLKRLPMFQALIDDEGGTGALLTSDERDFVAASAGHFASVLDQERRTSARLRRRGRLATTLAVAAVVLAVVAGLLFSQAQQSQARAEASESAAQSRQVALAAQQAAEPDPNLQMRLAVVADSLSTTVEARSALGDATSVYAPLRWAGEGPAVLATSPDGDLVARADGAGQVTLWRGDELQRGPGTAFAADPSGGPLTAAAILVTGGRTLLAVAGDASASVWDVTTEPRRVHTLEGKDWTAVAFSRDGRMVAFGNHTGTVTLIDPAAPTTSVVAKLQLPRDVPDELAPVRSLLFAPDAGTLFVGGKAHALYRWQTAGTAPRALPPIRYASDRPAISLALSPLGDQLVAGLMSRRILRWRLRRGAFEPLPEIGGFLSNVNGVAFTSDGRRLLAAGDDHGTYAFDPATGIRQQRLNGPTAVYSVAPLPGGRIVTTDGSGDLRVWPAQDPLIRTNGSTGYCFSADRVGHWLALATAYDGLVLWDTSGDGFRRMPQPAVSFGAPAAGASQEAIASGVAVDPQGRFVVSGTNTGDVVSWPLTGSGAGTPTVTSAIPTQYIGFMAVSPAGDLVAAVAVNDGSEVALLSADPQGRLQKVASIPARNPQSATFSPDGKLVAVPRGTDQVEVWSVADPTRPALVSTVQLPAQPIILTFAATRPLLAVGQTSGEVWVIDLSDPSKPKEVSRYTDARAEIYGLTWSPDGTQILGSGGDEHIWQWDATRPNSPAVASYSGALGRTNDVTFVHGGREFAATGDTGDVRVWIAGREDARRYICTSQGSPLSDQEWSRHLVGIPRIDPCKGI